jgi:hypothetical protein
MLSSLEDEDRFRPPESVSAARDVMREVSHFLQGTDDRGVF